MKKRIDYERMVYTVKPFPRTNVYAGEKWWERWEAGTGRTIDESLKENKTSLAAQEVALRRKQNLRPRKV